MALLPSCMFLFIFMQVLNFKNNTLTHKRYKNHKKIFIKKNYVWYYRK